MNKFLSVPGREAGPSSFSCSTGKPTSSQTSCMICLLSQHSLEPSCHEIINEMGYLRHSLLSHHLHSGPRGLRGPVLTSTCCTPNGLQWTGFTHTPLPLLSCHNRWGPCTPSHWGHAPLPSLVLPSCWGPHAPCHPCTPTAELARPCTVPFLPLHLDLLLPASTSLGISCP